MLVCLALLLAVRVERGSAQDEDQAQMCPQLISAALDATDQFCRGTGRNQVCYGHSLVQAEPQPALEDVPFDEQGDVVDATLLRALRVSAMNIDSGYWGVALMRLQANLPDTLPGQNVTLLLFGDVEIASATVPARTVDFVANTTLTVRTGPSNSSPPLNYLEAGQAAVATGRLADTEWLRVRVPNGGLRDGWVHTSLVTPLLGNFENLEIINPGATAPQYGPLQAIYLKTGVVSQTCQDVSVNGLLIQTPASAQEVSLVVNNVEVTLGSTIFVQAVADDSLTVSTLEGLARVSYGDVTQVAAPGTAVSVPLGPNLRAAGPPEPARPYDEVIMQLLPLAALDHQVSVPPPMPEDDVAVINAMAAEGQTLCGVPGLAPCSDRTISGLVTAISATSLTVDNATVLTLPSNSAFADEVVTGDYVIIEAATGDNGDLVAIDVTVMPGPAPQPASSSAQVSQGGGQTTSNAGTDTSSNSGSGQATGQGSDDSGGRGRGRGNANGNSNGNANDSSGNRGRGNGDDSSGSRSR